MDSSKMIGDRPKISNSKRSFLKLNLPICMYRSDLPARSKRQLLLGPQSSTFFRLGTCVVKPQVPLHSKLQVSQNERKNGITVVNSALEIYESWECFHLPPPVLCKVTQLSSWKLDPQFCLLKSASMSTNTATPTMAVTCLST